MKQIKLYTSIIFLISAMIFLSCELNDSSDTASGPVLSANAFLSNLVVSNLHTVPAFNKEIYTYYNCDTTGGPIRITPTVEDTSADITVNGQVVNSGIQSNNITIAAAYTNIPTVVTAENGSTVKTYTVKSRTCGGSCFDAVKNNDESDTDCGGNSCLPCTAAKSCTSNSDCISGACSGNICQ